MNSHVHKYIETKQENKEEKKKGRAKKSKLI